MSLRHGEGTRIRIPNVTLEALVHQKRYELSSPVVT